MQYALRSLALVAGFFCLSFNALAQAPEAIPYQAVARNSSGNLLQNQPVSLRFSIRDGSPLGAVMYQETHGATTNALGLFNVNIGQGTPVSGTFDAVDWGGGSKFTQVELDPAGGNTYLDMGTFQMLSVPYALYSEKSGNLQLTTGAANGHILQSDASGNASWVAPSAITTAIPTKIQDADTDTKIQVEKNADEDKIRFDLGGTERFVMDGPRLQVKNSGNSVFLGDLAGNADDLTNNQNTFVGKGAGENTASGEGNIAMGYHALRNATTGNYNVALGLQTLHLNTGSYNIGVGTAAGQNSTGSNNIFLGYGAGHNCLSGMRNVFLGHLAGFSETGNDKLYIDNTPTNAPLIWGDFSSNYVNINGNLGIGTNSPSQKLDVVGTTKTVGFQMPTGAMSGHVLQSDGSGNASWAAPSAAFTDTDDQTLSLSGTTLSISEGNSISLSTLADNLGDHTATQNLQLNGQYLSNDGDSEGLFVATNGNVGVGTNAPVLEFQIKSHDTPSIRLEQGSGIYSPYTWDIGANETNFFVRDITSDGDKLPFRIFSGNNSNRLTINGNNVGIGTISPSDPLHVIGNVRVDGGKIPFLNTGNSVFIGEGAGVVDDLSSRYNTFVGFNAGNANTSGNNNAAYGAGALEKNTIGTGNVALGRSALLNNISGTDNVVVGTNAGFSANGTRNVFLGSHTGVNATGGFNVFLGAGAGKNATGSNNIFLGADAGENETGNDRLYIHNSNTSSPLIWGDFGSRYLNFNGNVGIGTTSPSQKLDVSGTTRTTNFQMTSGATNGHILQSDASGNASWVSPSTLTAATSTLIQDADADTKIQVEKNSNEDKIRFDLGGTQHFVMTKAKIEVFNSGRSVFLGEFAGANDDLAGNDNTFIGYGAGSANTSGYANTAIGNRASNNMINATSNVSLGYLALFENQSGNNNTAIGSFAGLNSTGTGNLFLGFGAGYNETGSNKLYIDNSTTSSPLIWGDFSSNYVNINGNLGIGTNNPNNLLDIQSGGSATASVQSSGGNAYLKTVAPSGAEAAFNFSTYSSGNTQDRWLFGKSNTSEGGSNAGSNFFINRYSDAGTYLSQPFKITRSTGYVGIGLSADPTAQLDVSGTTKTTNLQMTNGAANGYVLQSDASGNASWVAPAGLFTDTDDQTLSLSGTSLSIANGNSVDISQKVVKDTDGDTKIQVEESADEDIIRFDLGGTEHFVMAGPHLQVKNSGFSVFIGEFAGNSDDLTDNRNTFVGRAAGRSGVSSAFNVAIGNSALNDNINGNNNVALGSQALYSNTGSNNVGVGTGAGQNSTGSNNTFLGNGAGYNCISGTGNVFIGFQAGFSETGNNKLYINNSSSSIPLIWGDFSSNYVNINGNLGIGTNTPTQAKLVVNGFVSQNLGGYGYINDNGNTGTSSGTHNYSIYASNRVAGSEFNAHSDARIKRVRGRSDNAADLATLMQLQITDYTLLDTVANGTKPYKKVIAQEVEQVYPQAVNRLTDVVPDIYQIAKIEGGFVSLEHANLKPGERVKLIFGDKQEIAEVTAVSKKGFQTNYTAESGPVFVFGREVSDFRTVDYEAISMLNVSATQALVKRLAEVEKQNAAFQSKVGELEKQNAALQSKVDEVDKFNARMDALEAMLKTKPNN